MPDSSGRYIQLSEAAGNENIPTTGLQLSWDTTDVAETTVFSNGPSPATTIKVKETGHYLVVWSMSARDATAVSSTNAECRVKMLINGTETPYGGAGSAMNFGQSASPTYLSAAAILSLTANDLITSTATKTDTDADFTMNRGSTNAEIGGIIVMRLPDQDNYLRLRANARQDVRTQVTSWSDIHFDIQDELDTSGFFHSIVEASERITLKNSGKRYLVCLSADYQAPNASQNCNILLRMLKHDGAGGSEVRAARSTGWIDFNNNAQNQTISLIKIIKTQAANEVYSFQAIVDLGAGEAFTGDTDLPPEVGLSIWEIGIDVDAFTGYEAGGGQTATNTVITALDIDTADDEDTATFDWSGSSTGSTVTMQRAVIALGLGNARMRRSSAPAADQRIWNRCGFRRNGTILEITHAAAVSRGDTGGIGNEGVASWANIQSYAASDTLDMAYLNRATGTDANADWQANGVEMQLIDISKAARARFTSDDTEQISETAIFVVKSRILISNDTEQISDGHVFVITGKILVSGDTEQISDGHLFVFGQRLVSDETEQISDSFIKYLNPWLSINNETEQITDGFVHTFITRLIVNETEQINDDAVRFLGRVIIADSDTVQIADGFSTGVGLIATKSKPRGAGYAAGTELGGVFGAGSQRGHSRG